MRKRRTGLWIGFALIVLLGVLTGCGTLRFITSVELVGGTEFDAEVGDFVYSDHSLRVTYSDGESEEIPLEEEMIATADRLKIYQPGAQTIRVVYGDAENEFTVNVKRKQFDEEICRFEAKEDIPYDGIPHDLRVDISTLPEGTVVTYPNGNVYTEVGSYEVKALLQKDGYETKTLTSTLTITPVEYPLDSVTFADATVRYDGTEKMILAENVPTNVAVSYSIFSDDRTKKYTSVYAAGTYRVIAHFDAGNPNYKTIPDREAVLTIEKAEYDLTGVTFEGLSVLYGEPYEIGIKNANLLPEGVGVSYTYESADGTVKLTEKPTKAGEYLVRAVFTGNPNYKEIPPMETALTIEKQTIDTSMLSLYSASVDFDGAPHSLTLTGTLPDGVKVTYENNGVTAAGTYTVKATFAPEDPENFALTVTERTATLIISPISETVPFSVNDLVLDEQKNCKVALGEDALYDATLVLTDADGKQVTAVEYWALYSYTVSFVWRDPDKKTGSLIDDVSGTVVFPDPAALPADVTVSANGTDHAKTLFEPLPAGIPTERKATCSYRVYNAESSRVVGSAEELGTYLVRAEITLHFDTDTYKIAYARTLTVTEPV